MTCLRALSHASATLAVVLAGAAPCPAQENGEVYRARLLVSGYLMRSAAVCGGPAWKRTVEVAMRYASGGELRQFSHAFPKQAEQWMKEGAAHFNDDVMKDGIKGSCAKASNMAKGAP